ncbi:MAG: YtxH domain-containing protein [Anaerolineaceae bacterium]|nr:YtxH domain-containing protein [Anaerolineaceae bacterium]
MFEKLLKFVLGILLGGLVGIVAASLLTPKSGEEIRDELKMGFDEIKLDYELGRQKRREELENDIKRRCGE